MKTRISIVTGIAAALSFVAVYVSIFSVRSDSSSSALKGSVLSGNSSSSSSYTFNSSNDSVISSRSYSSYASSHPREQIILDEVKLCKTTSKETQGKVRVKYRIGAYTNDPACYSLIAKNGSNLVRDPNAICGKGDNRGVTTLLPVHIVDIATMFRQADVKLCLPDISYCSPLRRAVIGLCD